MKFAPRGATPQRKGKVVHGDPCHKRGQERTNWTACETAGRHQGGRKGPFGQPGRHQGGRKGPIGQPARHQGGRKGPIGQLGRFTATLVTSEGRKGLIGQPARHQGGTREAGKDHLDSLGGTREAGKDQLDSLCYERAFKGNPVRGCHDPS